GIDVGGRPARPKREPRARGQSLGFPQHIMAMLFADVVGYTKLEEERIPSFVRHFMARIAEMVSASDPKPVLRNTWGDAIYLVFENGESAFEVAMNLRDLVAETDWEKLGLPSGISLRIGLHAGPVYRIVDPVLKRRNYTGSHVSRTARIEPITPPGQV